MDEVESKKLKENYPDFFENFPKKIAEVILSEETPFKISEICVKNGVEDEEKIEKIAYQITLVLLGQLSPKELLKTLEKELNLDPVLAKEIYTEASQAIFSKVERELSAMYWGENPPAEDSVGVIAETPGISPSKKTKIKSKEKTPPPKSEVKDDTYRELIE